MIDRVESGIDATCHLIALGKSVTVLDRGGAWAEERGDGSHGSMAEGGSSTSLKSGNAGGSSASKEILSISKVKGPASLS